MGSGALCRRLFAIVFAITLVGALLPSASGASSIFFLRDSNIWAANPDGSNARAVTTDGSATDPYDFVSAAKTANLVGFHRGGNTQSQFGTINPDGSGLAINPDNASMRAVNSYFTRLDDAGDRVTWGEENACCGFTNWYADSVATDGSSPQQIFLSPYATTMDARQVTFGDPQGQSLLYTDVGANYAVDSENDEPCGGTDRYADVLVRATPPPGSSGGPTGLAVYCLTDTFLDQPALSPDGQTIAAQSQSDAAGSSGQIVTIPVGGDVSDPAAQSPATALTPANSGDSLPDFSPDGTQIAFQRADGTIATVPVAGGAPTSILTDASTPAWSPYTLPGSGTGSTGGNGTTGGTGTTGTTGSTGTTGGTGTTGSTGTTGGAGTRVQVSAPKRQRVLRRKAILVRVSCSAACSVTVKVTLRAARARAPVARMSERLRLSTSGSRRVAVALRRAALRKLRAALRHHRHVKASIRVTGAGARPASATLAIRR